MIKIVIYLYLNYCYKLDIENDDHEYSMTSLKNNRRFGCKKINPGWSPSPKKIKSNYRVFINMGIN